METLKEENLADKELVVGSIKIIHSIEGGGIDTIRNEVRNLQGNVTQLATTTQDYWSNLAADNVITPVEKKELKKQFKTITSSYAAILTQAEEKGLQYKEEITAYMTAYNALYTYIYTTLALFSNMTESTEIPDKDHFNELFSKYYAAELNAQARIANEVVTYSCIPSSNIITKDQAGEPNVDKITWKFYSSKASFICYYKLYADGVVTDSGQADTADQEVGSDEVTEYKCEIYADAAGTSLLDVQSVPVLTQGSQAITVQLTNSNVTLAAMADGTTNDFSMTSTELHVYEGINELTYSVNDQEPSSFRVSIVNYYCTGSNFDVISPHVVIKPIESLYQDTGARVITIIGKTSGGETFTRTISQILSKAKAGDNSLDYLGAFNSLPENPYTNQCFLALGTMYINTLYYVIDQTKFLIIDQNKYLINGERTERGYIYRFNGVKWVKVTDKGSYIYTIALQDFIANDLSLPPEIADLASDIKDEAISSAVSQAVSQATEISLNTKQYYGSFTQVAAIPASPTKQSFFTWAGATQSYASSSSGQLKNGYVYKAVYADNIVIWSELNNNNTDNAQELMTALPDILLTKNAQPGYFSTVFCNALISNEAFIKKLASEIITLRQNGSDTGIIRSENYNAGTSGWQIKHDGSADFNSDTHIGGNLTVDGNAKIAADITGSTGTFNGRVKVKNILFEEVGYGKIPITIFGKFSSSLLGQTITWKVTAKGRYLFVIKCINPSYAENNYGELYINDSLLTRYKETGFYPLWIELDIGDTLSCQEPLTRTLEACMVVTIFSDLEEGTLLWNDSYWSTSEAPGDWMLKYKQECIDWLNSQ